MGSSPCSRFAHCLDLRMFTPDRASGLARLEAFLPHAGKAYARRRNSDFGPGSNDHVSLLSPWLRHRLVL